MGGGIAVVLGGHVLAGVGARAFGTVMGECMGQGYIRTVSARVLAGVHIADDGERDGVHCVFACIDCDITEKAVGQTEESSNGERWLTDEDVNNVVESDVEFDFEPSAEL